MVRPLATVSKIEESGRRTANAVVSAAVSEDQWDAYVATHPHATIDHLWRWREIFEDVFGHECVYLTARRESSIVGVLPLVLFRSRLFGRCVVSVPFLNYGGLLAADDDAASALLNQATSIATSFGASHVELRHQQRQFEDLPERRHKLAMLRSLPKTTEALWNETDRKARNQIRKARKEGLECFDGGPELVNEFYGVFARNMRDLGTPVYPKSLFIRTLFAFQERARVFIVRMAGRPVAAAIALRFRDTLVAPWASSLREARPLCANMLLYWAMLERATREQIRTFDFGRSSADSGTHQFKRQWGAREVPLHWEYVLLRRAAVPDLGPANPKFRVAIEAWKHCPLWLANALGPHIVRSIP